MYRKVAFVLLLLVALGGAFADSKGKVIMDPGTFDVNAGVGYGYGWGYGGLNVGGGAEYLIGQFSIAEAIPLSWGVAGRVGFGLGIGGSYLAAGALGTLHFSWGVIDWPAELSWLNSVDSYIGLGLQIMPQIGLSSIGGTSWFFADNMAVNVEGGLTSSTVGILLKL
jgi:hypothetical protein